MPVCGACFVQSYTSCLFTIIISLSLFSFPTWVLILMSSICLLSVQLRNLLWATSKHDVYLMQNYSVMHWSSLLRRGKEVLNVAKPLVPTLVSGHLIDHTCFYCTCTLDLSDIVFICRSVLDFQLSLSPEFKSALWQ